MPKECSAVIEVNDNQGIFYEKKSSDGNKIGFVQDDVNTLFTYKTVQKISEYQLDLERGHYTLPGMLTFIDMFGVDKIEHLNVRQRWRKNNPIKSLKTPIGVDTNGDTFYLDLHEKFHGPHGLIAGMTGSGKSEFIITYILSMAINYNPDEVAFVLIDYKGGGLARAFDNSKYSLPHLAGTITNLDGNAIIRSILSIKSELRRRQMIFNEAREVANEGTIDIYTYQKMYRNRQVNHPMPHLFIIADEFAELKSQQPEFLEQLISTARIGRSLGVHLILATQKPNGVVSEQIWANSKFKVCLKVQDRADSTDMIKKPDAASLSETGRFYLQVGYDELFEMGQSAWSGAPYIEKVNNSRQDDNAIEIIDNSGNIIDKIKLHQKTHNQESGKQIVKILEYLNVISDEDNMHEQKLWLPEIPNYIVLDQLYAQYSREIDIEKGLVAYVGELDNPYRQSKEIMNVDFTALGNTLIYGMPGSGDEMFISAVIYSLYSMYKADMLNTYLIDFGTETLNVFLQAPHTGGVVVDGENEKMDNLVAMLQTTIKNRRKSLAEYAGSILEFNKNNQQKMPYILVVINNYSRFIESYERLEESLLSILREGNRYGIYFLVSANSTSAIRYKLHQNFGQQLCLKMADKSEYTAIVGNTGGVYPNGVIGRGVIKRDEVYVFQTAHIVNEGENLTQYIKKFCKALLEKNECRAKQIPLIPKIITRNYCNCNSITNVPIGISLETYEPVNVDMKTNNIIEVIGLDSEDAKRAAYGIVESASRVEEAEVVIFQENSSIDIKLKNDYKVVNIKDRDDFLSEFNRAVARNNDYKLRGNLPNDDNTPLFVVFSELSRIFDRADMSTQTDIKNYLEKVEGFSNIYIIICDSYQGVGKYSVDNWYSSRIAGNGIWVGNGISDQIRLQVNRGRIGLKKNIDEFTGYYVSKGNAKLMRLLMPEYVFKESEKDE